MYLLFEITIRTISIWKIFRNTENAKQSFKFRNLSIFHLRVVYYACERVISNYAHFNNEEFHRLCELMMEENY